MSFLWCSLRRPSIIMHHMVQPRYAKTAACEDKTYEIVMVRHGESEWNQKNLFCGWYDAKLSIAGKKEAVESGKALKKACYTFDLAFTSLLTRAHQTLEIILEQLELKIPIEKTWRLNERHYGALTGLNKIETAQKYGEKQVKIWRRSYDIPPPPLEKGHPYYEVIRQDPRYKELDPADFPKFESLKLTLGRTLPYWTKVIVPDIKCGKKLLIVAHGNSLRSIVKYLENISDKDIVDLNLPTGIPFMYTLDADFAPKDCGTLQFLGDPETVKKAVEKVANQGKISKK